MTFFFGASDTRSSSREDGSARKWESQKLQARTLEGSTQPHCGHVFVTGGFCAADASTPVRRERFEVTTEVRKSRRDLNTDVANQAARRSNTYCGWEGWVYASICCASKSRLKATRRSSATAAKYVQRPR